MCFDKGNISEFFYFGRMDLGMFNRFGPTLKTRVQLEEKDLIWIDLIEIIKGMLSLCIERMFGLTNGCGILERIFCRLVTVIPVHHTGKVGGDLKERED